MNDNHDESYQVLSASPRIHLHKVQHTVTLETNQISTRIHYIMITVDKRITYSVFPSCYCETCQQDPWSLELSYAVSVFLYEHLGAEH